MQNPFVRFKRYRHDGSADPRENHATETLAACLLLSARFKRLFVEFLFDGNVPFALDEIEDSAVETQRQTDGNGTMDLLIEQPSEWCIVVEVKVAAPEDERHRRQIASYRSWLERTIKGEKKFVFSLVRNADPAFDLTKHRRKKWSDLYALLKKQNGNASRTEYSQNTDEKLIQQFLNYLEVENIVSTWNPKQILDFGKGVKATRALSLLFQRVEEQLKKMSDDFIAEHTFKENCWPRLEVGKKSWGGPNRLTVWYTTTALWEGEREGFAFDFHLWHRDWRMEWDQRKIEKWVVALRKMGFKDEVRLKGERDLGKDVVGHEFSQPPQRIWASSKDLAVSEISEAQIRTATDDDLVQMIVARVEKHCDIVSALKFRF